MVRVKIMFSLILVYHVGDTDFDTPTLRIERLYVSEPLFLRFSFSPFSSVSTNIYFRSFRFQKV